MLPSPRGARRPRVRRRNQLVEGHLGLVRPIAAHYAASSSEWREDLEQVGLLGLIRAADLYDSSRAVPFSAYARRHIRGAVLHHLRDTAPLVRAPRQVQERRQRLRRLEQRLTLELGRSPAQDELRLAMGLSVAQWTRSCEGSSLGQRLWLSEDQLEQLVAPAPDTTSTDQDALAGLAQLERGQRRVVQAVVLQGLSLREVARQQHSSAATVHRLLHRGLAALRSRLSPPSGAQAC